MTTITTATQAPAVYTANTTDTALEIIGLSQRIPRLTAMRQAVQFQRDVMGIINVLEQWERDLEDPGVEWSSLRMAKLSFKTLIALLDAHLSHEAEIVDELGDASGALIGTARILTSALLRLHTVRNEILSGYFTHDGSLQRHTVESPRIYTLEDRAVLNGMSPNQQSLFERQLDRKGHLRLTQQEQQRMLTAIRAELE